MVVAACDRRPLWSVQPVVTAVFRPACSRPGSSVIYQLSYVPLDSANRDQRSLRTIPTRRTQIRLSNVHRIIAQPTPRVRGDSSRTAYAPFEKLSMLPYLRVTATNREQLPSLHGAMAWPVCVSRGLPKWSVSGLLTHAMGWVGCIVCGSQQVLVVVFRHIGPLGMSRLSLIDSLLRVLFSLAMDDRVATVR